MIDFFGYNRTARSTGNIASSEFAIISVGGQQSLVQNMNVSYQQQVDQVVEVGDTNINFVPGRAQGSVSVSKLVGAGGFFSGWRGTQCGRITPISVRVSGGKCGFTGNGRLNFDGGIIQSVSLSMSAQQLQIAETANILVASMSAA